MLRRWALFGAVLVVLTIGTGAWGSPPPEQPHAPGPLARSTISDPFTIETTGASDMVVEHVTIPPGASGSWHTHPGPTLVAVKSGTATLFWAGPEGCTKTTYSAGQGFFDSGKTAHMPRNEGTEPLEVYVTHIVPPGSEVDAPAENPGGNCPK